MSPKMEMYCIETLTGKKHKVKGSLKVFATLHGQTDSEKIPLSLSSQEKPIAFRSGRIDTFYVVVPEVIGLTGLTLSVEGPKWKVDKILVKASARTYQAVFEDSAVREGCDIKKPLALVDDHTTPLLNGKIILGPLLKIRGNINNKWCVTAMIVTENVRTLVAPITFVSGNKEAESAAPICIYEQNNNKMWRFDMQIELTNEEQVCTYKLPTLDNKSFSFNVPAINQKPGILFGSCNDRAHPYNMSPGDNNYKSIGWEYMQEQASKQKYHILLLGGDQVYADTLFYACPSVRVWDKLPNSEKYKNSAAYFNDKVVEELNAYYLGIYVFCWMYRAMAAVTATIPTAMMFDDHDIYDGWGSLDPKTNDSDMMINIFKVAKKHFFLFQMHGDLTGVKNERIVPDDPEIEKKIKDAPPFTPFGYPDNLPDKGPFNICIDLTGGVSTVLLDLRTERRMFSHTKGIIMKENSYRNFEKYLATRAQRPEVQHLFLVLSVPIHYPDAEILNKVLDKMHHNLIDDVRDHYSAQIHKHEQARVLNDMAQFCADAPVGSRLTVLSGDVHVGCFATADIEWLANNQKYRIEQYVSSGIAALGPPKVVRSMMKSPMFRQTYKRKTDVSKITQVMASLPNGETFVSKNNFLCLDPTTETYKATWVANPKLTKEQKRHLKIELPLTEPTALFQDIGPSLIQ